MSQGNTDGARIYATNSIRKKNEALNLLRLSSRIDAVASRVETAVSMRQVCIIHATWCMRVCTNAYTHAPLGTFLHIQVTGNMTSVVRGLDRAMQTMDLERVREHTLDFFGQNYVS